MDKPAEEGLSFRRENQSPCGAMEGFEWTWSGGYTL